MRRVASAPLGLLTKQRSQTPPATPPTSVQLRFGGRVARLRAPLPQFRPAPHALLGAGISQQAFGIGGGPATDTIGQFRRLRRITIDLSANAAGAKGRRFRRRHGSPLSSAHRDRPPRNDHQRRRDRHCRRRRGERRFICARGSFLGTAVLQSAGASGSSADRKCFLEQRWLVFGGAGARAQANATASAIAVVSGGLVQLADGDSAAAAAITNSGDLRLGAKATATGAVAFAGPGSMLQFFSGLSLPATQCRFVQQRRAWPLRERSRAWRRLGYRPWTIDRRCRAARHRRIGGRGSCQLRRRQHRD